MKKSQILLASLALASAAFAQTNAPQTAPTAPAPAAPAPVVDAARLALAREVVTAMHVDKMFDGLVAQMKQMAAQASASAVPPSATPEQRQKSTELQEKIMDLSMEAAKGLIGKMDQIYAEVYTDAELNAMKSFFLSPEGQSMLAKQPQAMAHVMPLVQQMQRDLMPKIQHLVETAKAEAAAAATPPTPAVPATPAPSPAATAQPGSEK